MPTQYLIRRTDVPFVFKNKTFPDAVLAFSSYNVIAVSRPCVVRIEARAFASLEDLEANFNDYLKRFTFEFTDSWLKITEHNLAGEELTMRKIDALNYTVLNAIEFEYDLKARNGLHLTSAGLSAILNMPSVNDAAALADEWAIPTQP